MKKSLGFCVLLISLVILSSCGSGSNYDDFIQILENDGYVLTARDQESIDYYKRTQINEKFDLSLDVEALYVAYVNENERWAEVIVLKDADQAISLKNALTSESIEGRYIVVQEQVVLITFSMDTVGLFD